MLESTKGIVLQHISHKSNASIVKIFTEKYGTQSFIVKGVSSKKSGSAKKYFQPLSLIEFSTGLKENRTLQHLSKPTLSTPYHDIPFNIQKTTVAFFIAEVLSKALETQEADSKLFDFMVTQFKKLDDDAIRLNFHLSFMAQLTHYLGFLPRNMELNNVGYFDILNGRFSELQPSNEFWFKLVDDKGFVKLFNGEDISISNTERRIYLRELLNYYTLHHCDLNNLKSFDVLQQLYS